MPEPSQLHLFQYWDSESPPPEIVPLLDSYRAQNPNMHYRCFDRSAAASFIGMNFDRRRLAAFDSCAVPAMQSDYFRYCAVLAAGGFYSDADTYCVAPLEPLLPATADAVLFYKEPFLPAGVDEAMFRNAKLLQVMNGVFGFRRAGHPLMEALVEIATVNIERRISNSVWLTTGPAIVSALYLLSRMTTQQRSRLSDSSAIGMIPNLWFTEGQKFTFFQIVHDYVSSRHLNFERLFDGISVVRYVDILDRYIKQPDLSYKTTGTHWENWKESIFRDG